MIQSLTLNNFQSHKASTLTFCPGVNVLVGANDEGKSSIIRGIRWGVFNRPAGTEFTSYWADSTSVQIKFDDLDLSRIRTASKNYYVLNGTELVGFGQEVPFEVSELVRMDERNIQYQLEGPFLLNESPGAVARTLNKVVKLEKIDSSLNQARRAETEVRNKMTSVESQLEVVGSELQALPDFALVDLQLNQLKGLQTKLNNTQKVAEKLTKLIKDIELCTDKLDNVVVPNVAFSEFEAKVEQLSIKEAEYQKLTHLLDLIERQRLELERIKGESLTCQTQLKSLCPNLCPLCGQKVSPTLLLGAEVVGVNESKERAGKNTVARNVNTVSRIVTNDVPQNKHK